MNTSQIVVLGLLGFSLVSLAATGAEIYSRLSYLWGFLLVGNWLWSRLSLRGINVKRTPRIRRGHLGQIFEERYEVHNPGFLPRLWVEVKDESDLPGTRGSHVVTLIGGRQRRSYLARSRLARRGIFPLGPTIISSGDPFGLFPSQRTIPVQDTLLVYPLMVDVDLFPNPPGLLTGGEALHRRTHYVTANASGVREYAPGDSLNRIHWPTTVRRDKLMVKEFELDPQADIWLFLDAEKAVQSERPYSAPDLAKNTLLHDRKVKFNLPPATEEYLVSAAASLGRYFLSKRRAVGLVASGRMSTVIPPDRGGRQLGKFLEALALLRADGSMPISALSGAQAQNIARGSTVVLITPSVRPQVAISVDLLLRRGLRPIVVLIDSETFGGAPGTDKLTMMLKSSGVYVYRLNPDDGLELGLGAAA